MNPTRILAAIDGSENAKRALEAAISLSRKYNSDLFAVYVLPFPAVQAYEPDKAAKEKMFSEAKGFLEESKKSAGNEGVSLQYEILKGHSGAAIVDYAIKNRIDLIVIGSRGLSGLKEAFLGSVSSYVVHKSQVPVLVIK